MWSTHVAAVILFFSLHSTHVGCCARYALLTRDHRAVYPRSCLLPRDSTGAWWALGVWGRYCLAR